VSAESVVVRVADLAATGVGLLVPTAFAVVSVVHAKRVGAAGAWMLAAIGGLYVATLLVYTVVLRVVPVSAFTEYMEALAACQAFDALTSFVSIALAFAGYAMLRSPAAATPR
jgi:hypothetical protein